MRAILKKIFLLIFVTIYENSGYYVIIYREYSCIAQKE